MYCGTWKTTGHLVGDRVHYRNERVTCGRFACPTCFREGYVAREASRVEERLSYAMAHVSHRSCVVHYVVSPSREFWSFIDRRSGYTMLRSLAYSLAKSAGIDGGAWFFHAHRLGNRWDNKRNGECVEGPHWHILGDGWLPQDAWLWKAQGKSWAPVDLVPPDRPLVAPHEGTWVVWNLGVRESVYNTAFYLLTHTPAGVARGTSPHDNLSRVVQTVTWAGTMSYGSFRAPKPLEKAVPVRFCCVCRALLPASAWFGLTWEGSGPPPTDSGLCGVREWRADPLAPVGVWKVLAGI